MPDQLMTLFRPLGQGEFDLIQVSGFRRFPPRLPGQPIFYPVLTERYAREIAQRWNVRDKASGHVGYVARFAVRAAFLAGYEVKTVGASYHQEYWIPAEDLDAFNAQIVGSIDVIAVYRL